MKPKLWSCLAISNRSVLKKTLPKFTGSVVAGLCTWVVECCYLTLRPISKHPSLHKYRASTLSTCFLYIEPLITMTTLPKPGLLRVPCEFRNVPIGLTVSQEAPCLLTTKQPRSDTKPHAGKPHTCFFNLRTLNRSKSDRLRLFSLCSRLFAQALSSHFFSTSAFSHAFATAPRPAARGSFAMTIGVTIRLFRAMD